MTYADLTARLLAWLSIDAATDPDWATALPAIIEAGELRCCRECDFLAAEKTAVSTLLPREAVLAGPADWLIGRHLTVLPDGRRVALLRRDESFLHEYWPDAARTGIPKYWAEAARGVLLLAPTPAAAMEVEMAYLARPAGLSATRPTTWLSVHAPDLLFAACMVAAAGYQKNYGAQSGDPQTGLSWEAAFRTALAGVAAEERRRKGDAPFGASPTPPPSSLAPAP